MLVRREHMVKDGAIDLVIERGHWRQDIADHPKDATMLALRTTKCINGTLAHEKEAFTGHRTSVVWYLYKSVRDCGASLRYGLGQSSNEVARSMLQL